MALSIVIATENFNMRETIQQHQLFSFNVDNRIPHKVIHSLSASFIYFNEFS